MNHLLYVSLPLPARCSALLLGAIMLLVPPAVRAQTISFSTPGPITADEDNFDDFDHPEGAVMVQIDIASPSASEYTLVDVQLGGSASNGQDLGALQNTATLMIPPGVTTYTYPLQILDDLDDEATENILLTLANPRGGNGSPTIGGTNQTEITIADDEFSAEEPLPEVVVTDLSTQFPDYIELLVTQDNLDISGYTLRDVENSSGAITWTVPITFRSVPLFQNLRRGTIIVVENSATSADTDPADGLLILGKNDNSYFTGGGTSTIDINPATNVGDAGQLRDNSGNLVHFTIARDGLSGYPTALPSTGRNIHMRFNQSTFAVGDLQTFVNGVFQGSCCFVWDPPNKGFTATSAFGGGAPQMLDGVWRRLREPMMQRQTIVAPRDPATGNVTMTWNRANDPNPTDGTTGYLILRNTTYSFPTPPQDGDTYNIGDNLGGATVAGTVSHSGAGATMSFMDNPGSNCNYYRIYPFRFSGSSSREDNGRAYNQDQYAEVFPAATAEFAGDITVPACGSADLQLELTGQGPWTVQYTDGTNTFVETPSSTPHTFPVSPSTTTTYTITSVTDNATCTYDTVRPTDNITAVANIGAPSFSPTRVWDGDAGDGLWETCENWSPNGVPQPGEDVVLDNSLFGGNYTVLLPDTAVEVASIAITPGGGNAITLTLPASNAASPGLRLTDGTTALNLGTDAAFENASGAGLFTETVDLPNGGAFSLAANATYQHRSQGSDQDLMANLAADPNSTVTYDVPVPPGGFYFPTEQVVTDVSFGNLRFEASAGAVSYIFNAVTPVNSAGNRIVQGNLTIEDPAYFAPFLTAFELTLLGNLTNNSLRDPFGNGALGFFSAMPTAFRAASADQSITGAAPNVSFNSSVEIDNGNNFVIPQNLDMVLFPAAALLFSDGSLLPFNSRIIVQNPSPGAITGMPAPGTPSAERFIFTFSSTNGSLVRAVNTAGSDYIFPMGGAPGGVTSYEPLRINFSNRGSGAGRVDSVEISFNENAPGLNGLPFTFLSGDFTDVLDAGFWNVQPITSGGGTFNGTYSLQAYESGYTNGGATAYTLVKRPDGGGPWDYTQGAHDGFNESGSVVDARRTGLTSFSDFAIAASPLEPLPISFLQLDGFFEANGARLRWQVGEERNVMDYALERSYDAQHFTPIARQPARNNGTPSETYAYLDTEVSAEADRVFYRLKQFELDGSVGNSAVVELLRSDAAQEPAFTLFPNPTAGTIRLSAKRLPPGVELQLQVYDATGRRLMAAQGSLDALNAALAAQTDQLSNGMYAARVSYRGKPHSIKFQVRR